MRESLYRFLTNIWRSFCGWNAVVHLVAIGSTVVLVTTGFDGWYSQWTRGIPRAYLMPAAEIGFVVPVFVPLILWAVGAIYNHRRMLNTAWGLAQAAVIGFLVSIVYKAFTGRAAPPWQITSLANDATGKAVDLSHQFRFGFLRGGVFWGWPSSHTMVAFSIALAAWMLFPDKKWVRVLAMVYALYVGLGVSMTIHWYSDFTAGALMGSAIGIAVGKSYIQKLKLEKKWKRG